MNGFPRKLGYASIMTLLSLCPTVLAEGPPTTQPAPVEAEPEALRFAELPKNFGWLSSPDEEPRDLFDAASNGKFDLDFRPRFEFVSQDGFSDSYAMTARLRFGYQSKPYKGFTWLAQMEGVLPADTSLYSVPATGQGDPARAPVADPRGIELNQGYARYQNGELGLDLKAGRQRIVLDDQRFVGNVGWRQFEQTFDSASVKTSLGVEGLELFYAYVWHVQRIFGDNGPNFDSNSHFIHGSYAFLPEIKLTLFTYLLDFKGDSPINSTNSYGGMLTGKLGLDELLNVEEGGLALDYRVTYALQTDAADNPVGYLASFVAADLKLGKKGLGYAGGGYQLLGSDGGAAAFQFPLGTNHKFNGWADVFLVTPTAGLQDLYVYAGAPLPWDVDGKVVFHKFWSDQGGADFGWEIDALLKKQINRNWSMLTKVAYYQGNGAFADRVKFWLQTTYKF